MNLTMYCAAFISKSCSGVVPLIKKCLAPILAGTYTVDTRGPGGTTGRESGEDAEPRAGVPFSVPAIPLPAPGRPPSGGRTVGARLVAAPCLTARPRRLGRGVHGAGKNDARGAERGFASRRVNV
jgi:hypothetical protein